MIIKAGLYPISIARITPDWIYFNERNMSVAPTHLMLHSYKHSTDRDKAKDLYRVQYNELLDSIDLISLANEWESKGNICLLCYERPEEFCHRHLLAERLKSMGYSIEEFKDYHLK